MAYLLSDGLGPLRRCGVRCSSPQFEELTSDGRIFFQRLDFTEPRNALCEVIQGILRVVTSQ